jgi:protein-tyrosine phosphatase
MRLIFVCTGNTCRSPLAESIAKNVLEGCIVESRGLFAIDGSPISKNSQEIIVEKNLPESSTAKTFSTEDLAADYIFTMTKTHKHSLFKQYGKQKNIYTIKEFIGEKGDISDPFGGNKSDYEAIFEELSSLIVKIKQKIKEI